MDDKLINIPNDDKQNRLQLQVKRLNIKLNGPTTQDPIKVLNL